MKIKQPLISVIIPCYNGEKFIGEAIESVINQTYKNWELIIVDDGSTDNSEEIVKQYLLDNRIQYIQHKKNKGIPSARNTGIKKSNGEFIALLDDDDMWIPSKLAIQLEEFQKSKDVFGLVFGNIRVINSEGCIIHEDESLKINLENLSKEDVIRNLFLGNFIHCITVMFKSECITEVGGFNEEITWGGDDYDLWLRLANRFKFAYINKVLAIRRVHNDNYTQTERMIKGEIQLINSIVKKYTFLNKYQTKKIAQELCQLGRYKQLIGNFVEAKKIYLKAFSTCLNVGWKPYIFFLFALFNIKFNYRKIKNIR